MVRLAFTRQIGGVRSRGTDQSRTTTPRPNDEGISVFFRTLWFSPQTTRVKTSVEAAKNEITISIRGMALREHCLLNIVMVNLFCHKTPAGRPCRVRSG